MEQSLVVQLSDESADDEWLDTLTKYLREELLDLDATAVRPLSAGESPAGTRAFDVVAVGGLIVSWIGQEGLRSVVKTITSWLSRVHSPTQSVHLEIDGDILDLSAASSADQERLVDLFVTRHGD